MVSVTLASGHVLDVTAAAPLTTAQLFFSSERHDYMVAGSAKSKARARTGAYTPDGTVPLISNATAQTSALFTYWSAVLNDTLTTGSPTGLAWAADPAHGYELLWTEAFSMPLRRRARAWESALELTTYWSRERKDTVLVAGGSDEEARVIAEGYRLAWSEGWVLVPRTAGATGQWTPWAEKVPAQCPWPQSKDILGFDFLSGANPGYGSPIDERYQPGQTHPPSADTWYPSWAADGHLYTPFTDGKVVTQGGGVVRVRSVGIASEGYNATAGSAVIIGADPFDLNLTRVRSFVHSTYPYQGRYPCGSLVYNGTWFYGTYYLDNPNASVGGVYVGPNPGPDCGNWCVQGPFSGFRTSTDGGLTWQEARLNASSGTDNLFGETAANNSKIKFGAPHFVDLGRELEHSPDGKAYIVGHGARRASAIQTWMLGDEVYMARVSPNPAAMADIRQWEFYSGGTGTDATWAQGSVHAAQPLIAWENHTGVVTMTYHPAIRKYIMCVGTATTYPMMTRHFDTYLLESDAITGPWARVAYLSEFGPEAYFMHFPSKFLAEKATRTRAASHYYAFLMYSANFKYPHSDRPYPPNSGYHMNLQQSRFRLSSAFAEELSQNVSTTRETKDSQLTSHMPISIS